MYQKWKATEALKISIHNRRAKNTVRIIKDSVENNKKSGETFIIKRTALFDKFLHGPSR